MKVVCDLQIILFVFLATFIGSVQSETLSEPNKIFRFADHLYGKGDYYRAITEYERLLFLYPHHTEATNAQLRIAQSYYNGEKWDLASSHFRNIQVLFDNKETDLLAYFYLSDIAIRQNNYSQALDYFDDILTNYPKYNSYANIIDQKIICHLRRHDISSARSTRLQAPADAGIKIMPMDLDEWGQVPRKSIIGAGLLSTILPGAGQAYAGRWNDATLAFILNGLFFWGTNEAFRQDENVTGSLLLLIDTTLYLGNIYNAANGARKNNALAETRFIDNLQLRCGLIPLNKKDNIIPVISGHATF